MAEQCDRHAMGEADRKIKGKRRWNSRPWRWTITLHDRGFAVFDERDHLVCRLAGIEQVATHHCAALQTLRAAGLASTPLYDVRIESSPELLKATPEPVDPLDWEDDDG